MAVSAGPDATDLEGTRIPVGESTSGTTFRDTTPRRVTELAHPLTEGTNLAFGPALVLPLRSSAESVFGVLVVIRRPGEPAFTPEQLPLAAAFAEQAALALQLADDQRRLHELQVLGDRDRIARDLHDHVIQRLFALGLGLQSARQRVRNPELQQRLSTLVEDAQSIIGEIRSAIFDLHNDSGTTQLRKRLHDTIAELTAESALQTTVRMSGPLGVISAGLGEHAEAVVREALANTVRHARAGTVTVTVSVADDLVIDVTDDGVGLPDSVARSGLHNLADRAQQAGGTMSLAAGPEGGTRLTWSAPVS